LVERHPQPLEREPELEELAGAITRTASGAGGVILIEGSAGIGKTLLLAATREQGRGRGMQVLAARGAELEREFSFGIVRQLFEPLIAGATEQQRAELLAGPASLCRPVFEPVPGPAPADSLFASLHGLYWLAVNASDEAPLLLAVDDLHWSDQPSARFLEYLALRIEGLPILLVTAFRPAEPGTEQLPLRSLSPGPVVARLPLRPLSEEGSSELVRRGLSDQADTAFCRACHSATGGNPLLLCELVDELGREAVPPSEQHARAIAELGPKAVSRTVQVRLGRASPNVSRFAAAAAVLGDGASPLLAARLAELGPDEAYEAAAALDQLDILHPEPRIEFVHPLVRAAIYEELGAGQRRRTHTRAAKLLADEGASPERIAAHLMQLPPGGETATVVTLREAARRALAGGGAEVAVSYLRRAAAEPPSPGERGDVLFELGSAEALFEGASAIEHLEQGVSLTQDRELRARRTEQMVRTMLFTVPPERALEVASRAREELDSAESELRRRLEATLLFAANMDGSLNELADSLDGAMREAAAGDDFASKALLGNAVYREALACEPASRVVPRARRAHEGGLLIAEDNAGSACMHAILVLALADTEDALPLCRAVLEEAQRNGSVFAYIGGMVFACLAHRLRGELREAVADGETGFEAHRAYGLKGMGEPWSPSYLAAAQMERGELDEAARILNHVAGPDDPIPDTHLWDWFLDSRSRLYVERGDLRRGLAETLECGRRFERAGGRNPAFIPWRSRAALCLTGLGEEPERARTLADEELELARAWGAPRALGAALRARGVVVGGEEGLASLLEAVAVLDPSPARLELARALTDLGATLRRGGRRKDARDPLRRGMDLAHRCGAAPLAERARTELRATGARPRSSMLTGVESLTPSERRVAEMAASGLSNRELAQRLFVTQKTIEAHMRSIFRKLGIAARAELPDALRDAGRAPARG
jgi:DNA-binding CsgD family transcriptional regulator/tetratricopeptide (TPR) repeat protein